MAEKMVANFSRSGHPIFRASSTFETGETRSKKGERSQYTSMENIELLLRTLISANQLSIYGAIAGLCDEVPKGVGCSRESCST